MNLEAAKCDACPLGEMWRRKGEFSPVPVEVHPSDKIVILGEAPGSHEVLEGRPFVGPSGQELQAALDEIGLTRDVCQINNIIACRPPKNRLDVMLHRISRMNRQRAKQGKDLWDTPQVCCQPRWMKDIEGATKIICLGATAMNAIRGGASSIMGMRGACEEIKMPWGMVKVAYTVHPAFVLRSPKWRSVFVGDLKRAQRFFTGKLTWNDPKIVIAKSAQEVLDGLITLRAAQLPVAYDVETDAKNPLDANLRCVAFSNGNFALVVPTLSIDGKTLFYSPKEHSKVLHLLRQALKSEQLQLIGHNAGQYDRLTCEKTLGVTPHLMADTLLLHLLTDNEMPHNLGFVTSVYTDFVEAWKSDHTAINARSDEELHIYCAKDAAVTALVSRHLAREVRSRDQWHLMPREHLLQHIGAGMQRLGMRVDYKRLHLHEAEFEQKLSKNKRICREITSEEFNPLSTLQLQRLLFKEWQLTPEKYNEKTGDPSTDDETLRKMLTHHNLPEEEATFVQAVRMVRRYSKLLSTYIRPLRGELVLWDGRVHPAYNRLPATGRYSSSAPNAQNIPAFLRDIFIPEKGHVFVGADMDQLELRLIAEEANVKSLLNTINEGLDPHNENMEVVYGKSIWDLEGAPKDRRKKGKKKSVFDRTRGITKNVFYAWQYAASVPTIHQQVVSVEDDGGTLIYAHLGHRDVRDVVNGLRKAVPEIPRWWEEIRQLYRRQGYIADSVWQRRRDFKDEEKINELVNHPIQAGGASIVHESMLELVLGLSGWGTTTLGFHDVSQAVLRPSDREALFGFDFDKRTGLVNQCHDSLMFEVREEDAEAARKWLEAAMTRKRKEGAKLTYTAEASIGHSWLEV